MAQTSALLLAVIVVIASVSAGPIMPAFGGLGMYGAGFGMPYMGLGFGGYGMGLGGFGMGVMPYAGLGYGGLGFGGFGYGMGMPFMGMGGMMAKKYYD